MNLIEYFRSFIKKEDQAPAAMKYLIIGLGNMGNEYDHTRHNVGFDAIDALASEAKVRFKNEQLGDLAEYKYKGRQIYLLKPSTFMNLSGKSVRYWVQKLKIQNDHWLIIVDELQFNIGDFKLQKKGSSGGHNGLKSVQDLMQTSNYARIRIGIGNDFHRGQQVDYVLGKWKEDEWTLVSKTLPEICKTVHSFVTIGVDRAMSQHNKRSSKTSAKEP